MLDAGGVLGWLVTVFVGSFAWAEGLSELYQLFATRGVVGVDDLVLWWDEKDCLVFGL